MASQKRMEVDGYQQQQYWRPPPMAGLEIPPPNPQASQAIPYPPRHPPKQHPRLTTSTVDVCVSSSQKSLFEAYLLAFTLGLFGAHHFYLGRTWFGVAYVFTMGLFGVGYVVDLFRLPCLVREANRALTDSSIRDVKTKCDAYLLWFPCGLLGLHYFYLRKPAFGALYFFTFGLCGIGWLIDGIRIPWLVKEANERIPPYALQEKSTCMAYILGVSPGGLLGLHHYYLDRPVWGLVYSFTLGLMGVGWVIDWFRIWNLTRRANMIAKGEAPLGRKYVDDAYILWFPFGLIGLHHFYLHRHGWGCLYLFTLGVMGLGWLFDSCRLWSLVRDYNSTQDEALKLLQSRANQTFAEEGAAGGPQTIIHVTNIAPGGYPGSSIHQYPPPAYAANPQQPLYHVTFSQPPNYGSQNTSVEAAGFLPIGGERQPTPPPNYEATFPEKLPQKPE